MNKTFEILSFSVCLIHSVTLKFQFLYLDPEMSPLVELMHELSDTFSCSDSSRLDPKIKSTQIISERRPCATNSGSNKYQ